MRLKATRPASISSRSRDADVFTYIKNVEAADFQAIGTFQELEFPVKIAINDFVIGCKADGIWGAIKASCILAGNARTLNGALVPLKGSAPTNVGFAAIDHDRKTGLKGDGASKYLDSNRANNADGQNDNHNVVYFTTLGISGTILMGRGFQETGTNVLATSGSTRNRSATAYSNTSLPTGTTPPTPGLFGVSRSSSSSYAIRLSNTSATANIASGPPDSGNVWIFARNSPNSINRNYSDAQIVFYSIGASLDLVLFQNRLTALFAAFNAAIP